MARTEAKAGGFICVPVALCVCVCLCVEQSVHASKQTNMQVCARAQTHKYKLRYIMSTVFACG